MFFQFHQNNSGGSFAVEPKNGISYNVIIEADNEEQALYIAEFKIGLYFDGCERGMDCDCCGDRWSHPYDFEPRNEPNLYGNPVVATEEDSYSGGYVHYLDGRVVKVKPVEKEKNV